MTEEKIHNQLNNDSSALGIEESKTAQDTSIASDTGYVCANALDAINKRMVDWLNRRQQRITEALESDGGYTELLRDLHTAEKKLAGRSCIQLEATEHSCRYRTSHQYLQHTYVGEIAVLSSPWGGPETPIGESKYSHNLNSDGKEAVDIIRTIPCSDYTDIETLPDPSDAILLSVHPSDKKLISIQKNDDKAEKYEWEDMPMSGAESKYGTSRFEHRWPDEYVDASENKSRYNRYPDDKSRYSDE